MARRSKIVELHQQLTAGRISPAELVEQAKQSFDKQESELNSFTSERFEEALAQAKQLTSSDLAKSELAGIPTALKDNYNMVGTKTTASSNMLANYVSPYDATVTAKLKESGALIVGKTNMDAFAHGSSTATSDFGATKNPANTNHYPGGSSGGSAAAVAAGIVPYSIGSETAGSIRQPAAWCGIVGLAPTYGRISRYGVVAMGSSLDRPGPMATTVMDCAIVLDNLAGVDVKDATTVDLVENDFAKSIDTNIRGKKIGLPKQYWDNRINPEILVACKAAITELEKQGAEIVELDLLDPKYAIAVYTIVCRSEVSSNLARLDGVRYGHQSLDKAVDVITQIARNRGSGMGREAKKRIMTGTYTLSAGYYEAYYKKAQQVRKLIQDDLRSALQQVDIIIAPTTPTTALRLDDPMVDDPLFGELSDVLVEASALSGLPAVNLPVGKDSIGLPIGIQMIGDLWQEQKVLNWAAALEEALS